MLRKGRLQDEESQLKRKKIPLPLFAAFLILVLLHPTAALPLSEAIAQGSEPIHTQVDEDEAHRARPIIYHVDALDKDLDGIQDSLEQRIARVHSLEDASLPVIVNLYTPVSDQDLNWFIQSGGRITHVYRHVTYGFAGLIPAAEISTFAALEKDNLCMIEYNMPIDWHLDVSVPVTRVRPFVWNTYGYAGSPNQSIAILDTGIDDTHPDVGPFGNLDFAKKMVGWYDATPDDATAPQDHGEHGTHVAGIAAGSGTANGLQGSGFVETTFTYTLPEEVPGPWVSGYTDYIDVGVAGVIKLNCSWAGGNNVWLILSDPAGNRVEETSGTNSPLIVIYNTTGTAYPTGRYEVFVGNIDGPAGSPFSCVETFPYQGLADGYNLFTGVAPDSRLVGVKVFTNTGFGDVSYLLNGMDWIIAHKQQYHIVVASLSLGLIDGATDSTLDMKVDTMVQNGIVTTISAGNDFQEGFTIGSPGTAAYALTVAATNDLDGITAYSSNGDPIKNEYGLIKPDVAAPGGTFDPSYGNKIVSPDSNDVDAGYAGYVDQNADDYQQLAGTSMSAPHVAGLAASTIQALGEWTWTEAEALKVKMLICMTAFETQDGEAANVPPLDRGGKDAKEGYGRVSADAAIEAATMTYSVGDLANALLGSNPSDKKVWARQVSLSADNVYDFNLSVPAGADYDLYLYNEASDSYGQPIILQKSINAAVGANETLLFTPVNSGTYYIVVKWVEGDGPFNLQSKSTPTRDVAIIDVVPSAAAVYAGWSVNISVTVSNEGGQTETFTVTAYYDANSIGTQTITSLAPDAVLSMTFTWNTTGVTPCINYTVKAEAELVPNETDPSDNSFIDGFVKVKMWGDVTGDGRVDIYDLSIVGKAYGRFAGDPEYNAEVDFNRDGLVDIRDVAVVGKEYGKTCL